ncbi:MAG: hypothetical protein HY291_06180 [Planctomycetes bacterium]|nr:hypothetical protein [Planctomycetota bacterium]
MNRRTMLGALFAAVLGLGACAARAKDEDKARLFNTFYLEGEAVTWYLLMRPDRTFDLIGPDGRKVSGQFVASDKEVAFAGRHFDYKFENSNVTFTADEKDGPGTGVAADFPPRARGQKAKYISIQNWRKAGKDTEPPVSATPAPPPDLPKPEPKQPAPPPMPLARAAEVSGVYVYSDSQNREHTLKLVGGGTFEYFAPDGRKANGTYIYANGELTLDSGFHRRNFALAEALGGVQVSRRDTDVLKPGDLLGEMPPQERTALMFKRRGAAPGPAVTPPVQPVAPPPVVPDVKPVPAPEPAKPPEVVQPKPQPKPPEPPQPAGVKSMDELAGAYSYRPNPLVTENWTLKADGTFDYSDSNGAKVSGTAKLEGGVLKLKSGEVERSFAAALNGNILVLARTNDDNPKITNDLATMSPSVLKEAKYEKK